MDFYDQEKFDHLYGRCRKKPPTQKVQPSFAVIANFFTCFHVLKNYKKSYVTGDLIAGLTVAALNIPQGMAYATLAGIPPVVGIYMGFFSPLIYFFFGTSNHISVGTFAPVCMMLGVSVAAINQEMINEHASVLSSSSNGTSNTSESRLTDSENDDQLVAIASSVGLFSGIFLVLLGFLRLGFVGSYFSVSLVKGFTFGVAFHVSTSQVIKVLGLKIKKYSEVGALILTWRDMALDIEKTNLCSLIFGVSVAVFLYTSLRLIDRFKSKLRGVPIPLELIIVIGSTIISHFAHLHNKYGLQIVGDVPAGLPTPSVDAVNTVIHSTDILASVIQAAIPVALVSFAISLALAKMLAQKHNYAIHNNQELFALGFVDIVGSFFGCFPSAASPSRSNLQSEVKGQTQVASVVNSALMFLVMMFAGPLFYPLPYTALGAIILVALRSFFKQAQQLPDLFRKDKHDFVCWVMTAVLTIGLSITYGLLAGIVLSLLSVLWRSQKPYYFEMGRVNNTNKYRDINSYETIKKVPATLIFRFEMSLYFANTDLFVSSLKKQICRRQAECEHVGSSLKWVIIDGEPYNFVDHSGVAALSTVLQHCKTSKLTLLLVLNEAVILEKLDKEKFVDKIGYSSIFPSVHDAVQFVHSFEEAGGEQSAEVNGNKEVISLVAGRKEDSTNASAMFMYGGIATGTNEVSAVVDPKDESNI